MQRFRGNQRSVSPRSQNEEERVRRLLCCSVLAAPLLNAAGATSLLRAEGDRVCVNLDLIGPPTIVVPEDNQTGGGARGASIARGASGYAHVGWSPFNQLRFTPLDDAGQPSGPPSVLRTLTGDLFGYRPSIAGSDTGYAVAWRENGSTDLLFQRLDAIGGLVGPTVHLPATLENVELDLAWNGSEFAVVWIDGSEQSTLKFERLSAAGAMLSGHALLYSGRLLERPRLAAGPAGWGVVWGEVTPANLLGMRFKSLAADGTSLGADVAFPGGTLSGYVPDVTWAGDRYAVVWENDNGVGMSRFSSSGTLLGSNLLWMGPQSVQTCSVIGWTGSNLVIAWHSFSDRYVHALALSPDGVPLAPSARITQDSNSFRVLGELAWGGDRFAISWTAPFAGRQAGFVGIVGCDCVDADADDFSVCRNDCDDGDPLVRPGGFETCDGVDE